MSTATKLEYLNETKSKIKDNINLTGANITSEDTFRSYAGKLKQGLLDILNKGNDYLYNNFPQLNDEGQNMSLTPTLEAPIKSELLGNTSQNGTPTPDEPVEVINATGEQEVRVVGKNLCNLENLGLIVNTTGKVQTNARYWNCVIDTTNNNSLYVSGDYTLLVDNIIRVGGFNEYPALNSQGTRITSKTNTAINTTNYNYVMFCFGVKDGHTINEVINSFMITYGNEYVTYEAYQGTTYPVNLGSIELCKIGDYQDSIRKGTGKNLFNKDNVIKVDNKILNDSGVETSDNTGGYTKMYIPVNPNTTYTISGLQVNGTKRIYFFDNSKGFISRTSAQYNVSSFNFTTPNNCYYIDIQYYLTNNNFNTYQIEKGSTPTDYEPYGSKGKWLLTKAIGKYTFGNVNLVYDSTYNRAYTNVSEVISNILVPTNNNEVLKGLCNYLSIVNATTFLGNTSLNGLTVSSNSTLSLRNTSLSSQTDYNNWLSTNKPSLYYVLATPTIEEITDSSLINDLNNLEDAKSYNGTTNIIITGETPADLKITVLKNE